MVEISKEEIAARDKTHLLPDDPQPFGKEYGYEATLAAAGVKVLAFEQFGSYQGEWWAKIELPNGETYFIHDYYGSCSGCDAFEAEFGWNDDKEADYPKRMQEFGRKFVSECFTSEQAIAEASRHIKWDTDAETMVNWIKAHR